MLKPKFFPVITNCAFCTWKTLCVHPLASTHETVAVILSVVDEILTPLGEVSAYVITTLDYESPTLSVGVGRTFSVQTWYRE